MWAKYSRGFTAIELMVVIVIIAILVSIAVPALTGAQNRAKEASVKANMHALQTVVETYAVDWGAIYPLTVEQIETEPQIANIVGTLTDMRNPFTLRVGKGEAYKNEDGGAGVGMISWDGYINKYYIYGYGTSGNRIFAIGLDFTLSNGH